MTTIPESQTEPLVATRRAKRSPRLAMLLGAPHPGESSMQADLELVHDALRQRGLAPEEILWLSGQLDRTLVLDFFSAVGRRLAGWEAGELYLHVSAHGFFEGERAEEARLGIELQPADEPPEEGHLFWDDIFVALTLPPAVTLLLVPDH